MKQFDEEKAGRRTSALQELIPGEVDEDGVTFYFITIPLFQNLSTVQFIQMFNNELGRTSKIFVLDKVSVLKSYKITGILPPIREFILQEQMMYHRLLESRNKDNKSNEQIFDQEIFKSEKSEITLGETKLEESNDTLLCNLHSNYFYHFIKPQLYRIFDSDSFERSNDHDSSSKNVNRTKIPYNYEFSYEPPQRLSEEQMLIKLFNSNKTMKILKSKFNLLKSVDSENALPSEKLDFSFLKESTLQIFETPKDMSYQLKNFGFINIPSFSKVTILNYTKKFSNNSTSPNTVTRGSIIHLKNIEFSKNQCSFSIGFSQESKFRIFLLRMCNIKTFSEMINKLAMSFDVFLDKNLWATGLIEFVVDKEIQETDDSSEFFSENSYGSGNKFDEKSSDKTGYQHTRSSSKSFKSFILEKDPFNRVIHPLLKFTFKKHSNEPITVFNIPKFKVSFLKLLFNRKSFADLDVFHLACDFPKSIYIFDNFGNRATIYKFGENKTTPFSILLSHLFKDSYSRDFITIETEIDFSRIFTPLNNIHPPKFFLEPSHFIFDFPNVHFTVISSLFKIRSEIQESQIKLSRDRCSDSSHFYGLAKIISSVIFKNTWPQDKTFIAMFLNDDIELSFCDGLFVFKFAFQDFLIKKDQNVIDKIENESDPNTGNTPFFKPIPLHFKFDLKNLCYNSLLSHQILVSHQLDKNDESDSFTLCSTDDFRISHGIPPLNFNSKNTTVKPFGFHFRNVLNVENTIGFHIDHGQYSILNLKSSNVSFVIDVTSNGARGYFKNPTKLEINFPSPNDTAESFTDKCFRECELHSVMKFVESLLLDINKPNPTSQDKNNEQQTESKILKYVPEVDFIFKSENSNSFSGNLRMTIPRSLFNKIPYISIDPTHLFSLSSTDQTNFKISFDLKRNSTNFFVNLDFSIPKTMKQRTKLVTNVNNMAISDGLAVLEHIHEENFDFKDVLQAYVNFFKTLTSNKSYPIKKFINYSNKALISALAPGYEKLPDEFILSEDISIQKTVDYVPISQNIPTEIQKLKIRFDSITGTEQLFGLNLSLNINDILQDFGCAFGKFLSKIPFVNIPGYFNLSLNATNLIELQAKMEKLNIFNFNISELKSLSRLKVPLSLNDATISSMNDEMSEFVELKIAILSEKFSKITEALQNNFSAISFTPSFPLEILLGLFNKKTNDHSQMAIFRASIDYLPCLFLDIKSPYFLEFIGDELMILFDTGDATRTIIRFTGQMVDYSIVDSGYRLTIPLFLFHYRDLSNSNLRLLQPLNYNDKELSSLSRCFFIHKDVKLSYNLELKFPRDSTFISLLMTAIEYLTRKKARDSVFYKSISYLLEKLVSTGLSHLIKYSRIPVSSELFNRFIELTQEERNVAVDCLRNSPKILI